MPLNRRGRRSKNGLPPYVFILPSRHGNGKSNCYFRRDGTYTALHGEYQYRPSGGSDGLFYYEASPEWWASYGAALNGEPPPDRTDRGSSRTKKGSFRDVISAYKTTNAYKLGARSSIEHRNSAIKYILETLDLGDVPVASMKLSQLEAIIEHRGNEAYGSAIALLTVFRALFERARRMDIDVEGNIALSIPIPKPKEKPQGYLDWSEELIARYQQRHPLGSMARVGIEVFLNNGFRIGDTCRVGWWAVKDGVISDFITEKTGKKITVEIGPDLAAAIAAMGGLPSRGENVPWIVGPRGSYVTRSFRRVFRQWMTEAGIPSEYSPHGLRHSVARRLMDAEVPIEDAMTVTGHTDRKIFLHYAKKRDEARASKRATGKYAAAYSKERAANG